MKRNIEIEARLIDDLLDLTRGTRGKLALRLELCDLHSVIPHAVEMVGSEATAKSVSLKIGSPMTQTCRARLLTKTGTRNGSSKILLSGSRGSPIVTRFRGL